MEEACRLIENECNNKIREFNKTVFTDENFNMDELLLICNQIPMFADRRFILVKHVSKLSEADAKKLSEYEKKPSDECVLVFLELPDMNVFGKFKFEKVECKKLSEYELRKIVIDNLKESGREITLNAVNLFINFCLKDLILIKNEIEKLKFYNPNDEKQNNEKIIIDEKIIKKLVHQNDEYTIFEISDALTKSQGDRALNLLNKMLETKDFSSILGLISSHFRRMMYSAMSGGTTAEIASKLGVKEYAVIKSKQTAKQLKLTQILEINELILNINFQIKDGKIAAKNAMYYLVFKIIEILQN
jgi:DNA polymerase III delta subunit